MTTHDRFAAHEFIHHWWFNYDEGNFDILFPLLTDDCHVKSRTERGDHPHEQFIAADTHGPEASMAWTREHRRHSPNIFVKAERGDEIDLESYLFVTQIRDNKPSALSSWHRRLHAAAHRRRLPAEGQGDRARLHRIDRVPGRTRGTRADGPLVSDDSVKWFVVGLVRRR